MNLCKECPYIKDKIKRYDLNKCYCNKLDDKISVYGCCEEEVEKMSKPYVNKKRKSNRYERKIKYKQKLKRIADSSTRYPAGAYYVSRESFAKAPTGAHYKRWVREHYIYVKRQYRTNHVPGHSGYLKKYASKRFRRYKGELPNGCGYKKTFDYWWELT